MAGLLAGQLVSFFYGTIFGLIGCGADGQMGTEHRARGVLDWGHGCVHLELLPRQLGFCTLQLYALIDERPLLHPRIRCAHAALARTHSTRASARTRRTFVALRVDLPVVRRAADRQSQLATSTLRTPADSTGVLSTYEQFDRGRRRCFSTPLLHHTPIS